MVEAAIASDPDWMFNLKFEEETEEPEFADGLPVRDSESDRKPEVSGGSHGGPSGPADSPAGSHTGTASGTCRASAIVAQVSVLSDYGDDLNLKFKASARSGCLRRVRQRLRLYCSEFTRTGSASGIGTIILLPVPGSGDVFPGCAGCGGGSHSTSIGS